MDNTEKKPKSIKKIVIAAVILILIDIPLYYFLFGIGYAKKEYKFDRLDSYIWFYDLSEKTDDENPFPLEINIRKIPSQYSYLDFNGYRKEPNWYNYYIDWCEIYTESEYKTFFLYDITFDWPGHQKIFTYNEKYVLPGHRDFKINTGEEDVWNEDHSEKEWFDLKAAGFYTDNLFAYRLDYLNIPPIKFDGVFNYRLYESFQCKITVKYSLDKEEAITESYDFFIEVKKGSWWNPNAL